MKKKDLIYTNSEMEHLIDEHCHSARNRIILKLYYLDDITHEKIAEKVELTPRQVSNIISKETLVIADFLEKRI